MTGQWLGGDYNFFHLLVALVEGFKTVYLCHLDSYTMTMCTGYLVSFHVVTLQLPTRCLVERFLHRPYGSGYLITQNQSQHKTNGALVHSNSSVNQLLLKDIITLLANLCKSYSRKCDFFKEKNMSFLSDKVNKHVDCIGPSHEVRFFSLQCLQISEFVHNIFMAFWQHS